MDHLLKKIAQYISRSNNVDLSMRLLAATDEAPEVVTRLQALLKDEYLQRDLYQAYDYLLFGPESIALQEHLREHLEEETEHVRTLQRYLVSMGEIPTLERKPIPSLPHLALKSVLEADLQQEREAVQNYTSTISFLEGKEEFTALRVDLENILSVEMEHTQDLERYLAKYTNNRPEIA